MSSEKGSIFILSLWVLLLLSLFAFGVGRRASQEIQVASYFQNKPRAHYLAEAAIKRAQGIVGDRTRRFDALNSFWSVGRSLDDEPSELDEVHLGGGIYRIQAPEYQEGEDLQGTNTRFAMVDEERKISINKVPREVLEGLFRVAADLEEEDALILADSVIDWRDTDNKVSEFGAEEEYYQELTNPYPIKNNDFQVLEELLWVRGMTDEIFLKVKDVITVYGDGRVNIHTASPLAFQALGMTENMAEKIIFFRNGEDEVGGTQDDRHIEKMANLTYDLRQGAGLTSEEITKILELSTSRLLSTASAHFTFQAVGEMGGRVERILCTVDKMGKIRYWRE